jgi:hypothetical protein
MGGFEVEMVFPIDQMHETVTVYPKSGNSAYGAKFGVSYEETCYLEPGFKTVTDSRGQEVVSNLFGIFRAECEIAPGDELVWNNRRYRAIDVQPMRFGGAGHHVEAYFGSVGGG